MSKANLSCRLLAALLLSLNLWAPAHSQTAAQNDASPKSEQLLNGLKIIFIERQGDPHATLRLRINSGAAFDLAEKEGMMSLLADLLFPDASTREYVTGDLEGRLDISTSYDSIDIALSGRGAEIDRMVELLRNALVSTQLSPEIFSRIRDAKLKTVKELGVSPVTQADRAIALRLYGAFPYGRLLSGTPESLARIERGDIIQARERFLNPNNATLVVIGGFDKRLATRALKQYLGAWRKSDLVVPQTFRQPDTFDPRTLLIDLPGAPDTEIRVAARGLTRSDSDFPAALVLAEIARERWLATVPELKGAPVGVRHSANALGGTFLMSASVSASSSAAQALDSARKILEGLTKAPPVTSELEAARRVVAATLGKEAEGAEHLGDVWLDETTYGTRAASHIEVARRVGSITPADVQRVAMKLFQTPAASVAVGDAGRLREELSRLGEVEVFNTKPAQQQNKTTAPAPLKAAKPRRP